MLYIETKELAIIHAETQISAIKQAGQARQLL